MEKSSKKYIVSSVVILAIIYLWVNNIFIKPRINGIINNKNSFRFLKDQENVNNVAKKEEIDIDSLEPNTGEHDGDSEREDKGDNKHEHEEEHSVNEALVVYFIIICLIIGSLCKEVKKLTGIPFSPLLLVAGILLAYFKSGLGVFEKSIDLVLEINPHGILYIFIPVLIFESAFNSDPFVFKKEIYQILILAGPGVLIGTFILAFFFRIFLNYASEFSWVASFTFASIVCATDPVAVVALLKELGASTRFSILLEGESLLNDGTAMVFYLLFSSIYKSSGLGPLDILFNFLRFSIGGPIFGILICLVIILWIRRIVKDDMLTMNLTFIACYFTFFVGEYFLEVSGILAIVALGITMGNIGRIEINPESEHAIHSVWSFLQLVMEIIIFIITGCFLSIKLFLNTDSTIDFSDWVRMFLFFILMIIGRYLMLILFKPVINKVGYPIDNKDIIILTYGGLRGAIALCLALIVVTDLAYPTRFREIVIFYVSGMILLTVIINGLTIKYIIDKINFQPISDTKKRIKLTLKKRMIIGSVEKQQSLIYNEFLKLVDWKEVYNISGLINQVKEINDLESDENYLQNENTLDQSLLSQEKLHETRMRFYKLVKAKSFELFENNMCDTVTIRELNEICDLCLEELNKSIWIWECISNKFISIDNLESLLKKKDMFLVGYYVKTMIINNLLFSYAILSTILKAMTEVIIEHSKIPLPEQYIKKVFNEIKANIKNCESYLYQMTDLFPDLVKKIQTLQATKIVLNSQKHLIDEYLKEGYINNDEYDNIRHEIDKKIKNLTLKITEWEIPNLNAFNFISHIFGKIEETQLNILETNCVSKEFKEGEIIINKDGLFGGIYIIVNGVVQELFYEDDYPSKSGLGSIFSFANIINPDNKAVSEVKAVSNTKTYFIPANVVKNVMNNSPSFKEHIYKNSFFSLIKYLKLDIFFNKFNHLHTIVDKSKVLTLKKGDFIGLDNGGFIFEGRLRNDETREENGNYFLYNIEKSVYLTAVEDCILLKFDDSISHLEEDLKGSINMATTRNSIINIIQKEKDTDNLFNILKTRIEKQIQGEQ